jgi:hypothetical protein
LGANRQELSGNNPGRQFHLTPPLSSEERETKVQSWDVDAAVPPHPRKRPPLPSPLRSAEREKNHGMAGRGARFWCWRPNDTNREEAEKLMAGKWDRTKTDLTGANRALAASRPVSV